MWFGSDSTGSKTDSVHLNAGLHLACDAGRLGMVVEALPGQQLVVVGAPEGGAAPVQVPVLLLPLLLVVLLPAALQQHLPQQLRAAIVQAENQRRSHVAASDCNHSRSDTEIV